MSSFSSLSIPFIPISLEIRSFPGQLPSTFVPGIALTHPGYPIPGIDWPVIETLVNTSFPNAPKAGLLLLKPKTVHFWQCNFTIGTK